MNDGDRVPAHRDSSARKSLDLDAPVDLDDIRDCLRIGLQAANGSNAQSWRWLVISDPALRTKIAELYRQAYLLRVGGQMIAGLMPAGTPRAGSCHRRSGWSSTWRACHCW